MPWSLGAESSDCLNTDSVDSDKTVWIHAYMQFCLFCNMFCMNLNVNFQLKHVYFQAGFLIGYVLLFGNEMLITSFFASSLLTISVSVLHVFMFCV